MVTKTIQVALPEELNGFVERVVRGGRYMDASEVVREALRRMEAAELGEELGRFEQALAGGHERAESDEDIQRVEAAVRASRAK